MSESLISVDGISKKLCREARRSMYYGLADIARCAAGLHPDRGTLRRGEFWAVKDLSFDIRRGECLGVIGPNGSGKSTLLKMINGIILPDKGSIRLRGRVGSLIELGAGFHPMLSGRENILINGAILGYSKSDLSRHMDDIVEFAELREFIDMPVRNYSSGMYVRLGFAIAAHFKPDILLIDEILAVGDIRFRARCFNTIYSMLEDTAVVIVSHSMADISRVCDRVLVLDRGNCVCLSDSIAEGIEKYTAFGGAGRSLVVQDPRVELHAFRLLGGSEESTRFRSFDPLVAEFDVTLDASVRNPAFYVSFAGNDSQPVMQCYSINGGNRIANDGTRQRVRVELEKLCLNPGKYSLTVGITSGDHGEVLLKYHNARDIRVAGDFVGYAPVQAVGSWNSHSIEAMQP
jgi:lipopolysaccharide transport system ATP-binding protein